MPVEFVVAGGHFYQTKTVGFQNTKITKYSMIEEKGKGNMGNINTPSASDEIPVNEKYLFKFLKQLSLSKSAVELFKRGKNIMVQMFGKSLRSLT